MYGGPIGDRFLETYGLLRKAFLLKLDMPYDLPELHDFGRVGDHYQAVIDAFRNLPGLPGDGDAKYFLGELALKWLTGIEMYRKFLRDDNAVWASEAAEMMLAAFESTWGILDNLE